MGYSMKYDLNADERKVVVTLKQDDEVVEVKEYLVDGVHADVRNMNDCYGLSKKIQDGSSQTPPGPEKIGEMDEIYATLASGRWNRERKGGTPTVSIEVRAIAEVMGYQVSDVQKLLSKYDKEQKAKIFENDRVAAKIAELRKAEEGFDEEAAANALEELVA